MSSHHSVSYQIRSSCDDCATPTGAKSFIHFCIFPLSTMFSFPLTHTLHSTQMNMQTKAHLKKDFGFPGRKTSCLTSPLSVWFHSSIPWLVWGPTQSLCRLIAEKGSDLEEQWNGSRGRASGASGARNVNWEDCFNKTLIFADAGRGLADGATQMGGQFTVTYCQQT